MTFSYSLSYLGDMGIVIGLVIIGLLAWIGFTLRDICDRQVLHGQVMGELGLLLKRLIANTNSLPQ